MVPDHREPRATSEDVLKGLHVRVTMIVITVPHVVCMVTHVDNRIDRVGRTVYAQVPHIVPRVIAHVSVDGHARHV